MGFAQPIMFIIGYVDVALLVFLVWIVYRFLKRFVSTLRPDNLPNEDHPGSHNLK
jgi:hypothetical protein